MMSLHRLPALLERCHLPRGHAEHLSLKRLRRKVRRSTCTVPQFVQLKQSAKYIPNRVFLIWLRGQLKCIPQNHLEQPVKIIVSSEQQLQAELEWYVTHWKSVYYRDDKDVIKAKSTRMEALRRLGKYSQKHYSSLLSKLQKSKCYSLLEDMLDVGINVTWEEFKDDRKALGIIIASYLQRLPSPTDPPCSELMESVALWRQDERVQYIIQHIALNPSKYLPPYYPVAAPVSPTILERRLLPGLRFHPDGYPSMGMTFSQKLQEDPALRVLAIRIVEGATLADIETVRRATYQCGDRVRFMALVACCAGRMDVFAHVLKDHGGDAYSSDYHEFAACSAYCGQTHAVQMLARMGASAFFIVGGALSKGVRYNANDFFKHCYPPKPRGYSTSLYVTVLLEEVQRDNDIGTRTRHVTGMVRQVIETGDADLITTLQPVIKALSEHNGVASVRDTSSTHWCILAANTGQQAILDTMCQAFGRENLTISDYQQLPGWFNLTGLTLLFKQVAPMTLLAGAVRNVFKWSKSASYALKWLYPHIRYILSSIPDEQKDTAYRKSVFEMAVPSTGETIACSCDQDFLQECHASNISVLLINESGMATTERLEQILQQQSIGPLLLCPNLLHLLLGTHPCKKLLDDTSRSVARLVRSFRAFGKATFNIDCHLYLAARRHQAFQKWQMAELLRGCPDTAALTLFGLGCRNAEQWPDAEQFNKLHAIWETLSQLTGCDDLANLTLMYV